MINYQLNNISYNKYSNASMGYMPTAVGLVLTVPSLKYWEFTLYFTVTNASGQLTINGVNILVNAFPAGSKLTLFLPATSTVNVSTVIATGGIIYNYIERTV